MEITEKLKENLCRFPLYSQDGKGQDAICVAIFALGSIRWFVLEGEMESDDITMFGIVVGLCEDEYGYFSLNELSSIEVDLSKYGCEERLKVRLQENFSPTPLKNLKDNRLQSLLERLNKDVLEEQLQKGL